MLQTLRSNGFIKKIRDWISARSFFEIVKYVLLSIGGYVYVVVCLYVFVDWLGFNESISYMGIYFFAYLFDYYLTLRLIFHKEHKTLVLIKYIVYLGVFFALNNLLFNGFLWLDMHYVVASVAVIAILFPLRFIAVKFVVFK